MKSKILLSLALSVSVMGAIAQKNNVGIGTTKPDQSAALEVNSTNQGFLIPRMSLQQRNEIQNPATGLMVYQSDFLAGTYQFDGKEWKTLGVSAAANSVADANNWGLLGNSGVNSAVMFLGTTAGEMGSFNIKLNNTRTGFLSPGSLTTYLGYEAGLADANTSELFNTALGYRSLKSNTAGTFNLAFGIQALTSNTSGGSNVAIGTNSMQSNTQGAGNLAVGANTLQSNTLGGANLALGTNALQNNVGTTGNGSGSFNTGIGTNALKTNTFGNNNVGIGTNALTSNATGNSNIGIGTDALNASIGNNNVGIGDGAGKLNTGSNNLFLGYQAGFNETGNSKLYLANTNTTEPLIYGDFSAKYLAVGEVAAADRAAAVSGGYRLLVKGGMMTEKIKVAVAGSIDWADYVFEDNYKMLSLENVEKFIKENKHLPNVPSTTEVLSNGIDVAKTDAKLLEKIEELTLYMIEMNKEIKILKQQNKELKKEVDSKK